MVIAKIAQGRGLEIGGPSEVFSARGIIPVYSLLENLDNCNFSNETLWEGELVVGSTFHYHKHRGPGWQYILEATDLSEIDDGAYDFILSSHVLEHCANPLKALGEWTRVLVDGGFLIIVLPHREGTFDHLRPVTPLPHMVEDYERGVGEDDETHFEEIARLHDLDRDPDAGKLKHFHDRMRRNASERSVHHHVFDTQSTLALIDFANFQIHAVESLLPFHIVCLAQKVTHISARDNSELMGEEAHWRKQSPFLTDRRSATHRPDLY